MGKASLENSTAGCLSNRPPKTVGFLARGPEIRRAARSFTEVGRPRYDVKLGLESSIPVVSSDGVGQSEMNSPSGGFPLTLDSGEPLG